MPGARTIKALLFGLLMGGPILAAKLIPQFKWVFFFFVAAMWYGFLSRVIRAKSLRYIMFAIGFYIFYRLWFIIGALYIGYFIAGSLSFGMISSIIIFGVGER